MSEAPSPLRVLHLEDDPLDVELVRDALEAEGQAVEITHVETRPAFEAALASNAWDVILADYTLPSFGAIDALAVRARLAADTPLVIVSGTVGEELAIDAMRAGASDYVLKDRLGRLVPAMSRAVRERDDRRARIEAEEETARHAEALAASRHLLAAQGDILELVVDSMAEGVVVANAAGRLVLFNRAAEEILGRGLLDVGPESWSEAYGCFHTDGGRFFAVEELPLVRALAGERVEPVEMLIRNEGRPEGVRIEVMARPLGDGRVGARQGAVAVIRDVTEQLRHQKELLQAEAQLRQAQKMEGIGRLAGGIAHDFNNLLSGIIGFSELALGLEVSEKARRYLEQIHGAGEKAAGLTRQLLAFGRKQRLAPRVVSLNAILEDSIRLLERLIGEDIELVFDAGADLASVRVDPHQLEQVILNLCVNARDAMPDGGRLLIETANELVEPDAGSERPGLAPGRYVRLSVADTGVGMDAATLEQIFEPFFTTKAVGKGTGLGLATVHGIVKQSGGHLWVDSRPGEGTVFRIVFPAVAERPATGKSTRFVANLQRGDERLLVVEDDDTVAELARMCLQTAGYTVELVRNAEDALRILEGDAPIDLLLTDVVMPGMRGTELARRARELHPGLAVILMSGYAETGGADPDSTGDGFSFLQKPITPRVLSRCVRETLAVSAAAVMRGSGSGLGRPAEVAPATVLVVDDSLTVRGFAGEVLEEAGYRVLLAESPAEALALGQTRSIDLILSDVVMPGMTGPELVAAMRESTSGALPVLFMSGYTQSAATGQGLLGADEAFIEKPFSPEGLVSRVGEALGR